MKLMKRVTFHSEQHPELSTRANVATSMWARFWGLMGKAPLPEGEALIIDPCSSVHTMFMRFAIDVVYLDREHKILKVAAAVKPYRTSAGRGARSVIEMPAGAAERAGLTVGDRVVIEPED
jgi:uncharacterized membrane protein (UPF0127 family)